MTRAELIVEVDGTLNRSGAAVLATVGGDGRPHMRWMTPVFLKERSDALYAATSTRFAKTGELEKDNRCQWLFQTKTLDTVVTLNGIINCIDNSALKAEVLEAVGRRLHVFWRISRSPEDLIILETVIEEGILFKPMKASRETISFRDGGTHGL